MEFFTDENFVIDKSDIINHVRVITKDPNTLDEFIKRYILFVKIDYKGR